MVQLYFSIKHTDSGLYIQNYILCVQWNIHLKFAIFTVVNQPRKKTPMGLNIYNSRYNYWTLENCIRKHLINYKSWQFIPMTVSTYTVCLIYCCGKKCELSCTVELHMYILIFRIDDTENDKDINRMTEYKYTFGVVFLFPYRWL